MTRAERAALAELIVAATSVAVTSSEVMLASKHSLEGAKARRKQAGENMSTAIDDFLEGGEPIFGRKE